jgi:hypothetical protein
MRLADGKQSPLGIAESGQLIVSSRLGQHNSVSTTLSHF